MKTPLVRILCLSGKTSLRPKGEHPLYLTFRGGVDRSFYQQKASELDPASVGFPSSLNGYFGLKRFPEIGPEEYGFLGQSCCCCTDTVKGQTQWMYDLALTKVIGGHNLKFGGEQRIFFNSITSGSRIIPPDSSDSNAPLPCRTCSIPIPARATAWHHCLSAGERGGTWEPSRRWRINPRTKASTCRTTGR